jgi:hypothetical protein
VTIALIIFGMLAALWSGFFIGYYKREGKPPEVPIVTAITRAIAAEKPREPDKEELKANTFFN